MATTFTPGPCGMTKRAFLHANGLTAAPEGKGRFSTEALTFLGKAVMAGVEFEDAPKPVPAATATPSSTSAPVSDLPTRRDFAATKGLAIAGGRGRLSYDAWQAILEAESKGERFADSDKPIPASAHVKPADKVTRSEVKRADKPETVAEANASKWTAPAVPVQAIVRPQETHYGLSPEGAIVGWDVCTDCMQAVQYCKHDIPRGPKGVEFITTDKSEVLV